MHRIRWCSLAVASALLAGSAAASGTAFAKPPSGTPSPSQAAYDRVAQEFKAPDGGIHRYGVVPTTGTLNAAKKYVQAHSIKAASPSNLIFNGGADGTAIAQPKVYVVYYGSQWGTETNGTYPTFSGDPKGVAPYLEKFLAGLGTDNELWSGIATQYCNDAATGSQVCASNSTQRVPYPSNSVLAGVWEDTSAPGYPNITAAQLQSAAEAAAAHFGNTTAASNRNAQYVVVSPTGGNPDSYQSGGFCAWHSWDGTLSYTNMPYLPDAGTGCGSGFVNSGNILDSMSIVEGHEYTEANTDLNASTGWLDSSGSEIGDKCAWVSPGTSGGAFNLATSNGPFAVQGMWANDAGGGSGGCDDTHPVAGGNTWDQKVIAGTAMFPLVVDDANGSTANGNKIQVWQQAGVNSIGNLANQQWTVVSKGSYDVFELTKDPAACLDVSGFGTGNGTKVQLYACNGGVDQKWLPEANGTIEAVNASSVRGTPVVLDDPLAGGNSTQLQIWQANSSKQQRWAPQP